MLPNVLETLIDRITDNYKKDPESDIYKLMQISAKHIQENEDTLTTIDDWRDIDNAQGKALEKHGSNVRQNRGQAPDELYRVLIKSKIKRSLSNGSIDTIIDFLSFVLQIPASQVEVRPLWSEGKPATLFVNVPGGAVNATGLSFSQFGQLVNLVVVAGVRAEIASEGTFAFSSDYNNSQFDVATGAADGSGNGGTLGQFYNPANSADLPI